MFIGWAYYHCCSDSATFISLWGALRATEDAEGKKPKQKAGQTENNCPFASLQINIAGVLSWRVHVAISETGQQCLQDLLHYSGSTNKRSGSAIIYLNQSVGMSPSLHHHHHRGAHLHFHPVHLQEIKKHKCERQEAGQCV